MNNQYLIVLRLYGCGGGGKVCCQINVDVEML